MSRKSLAWAFMFALISAGSARALEIDGFDAAPFSDYVLATSTSTAVTDSGYQTPCQRASATGATTRFL